LIIRAGTPADLRRAVLDAAAAYGARLTDLMSDDEVLEELRERMLKQGMVVQIEHLETPGLDETPRSPAEMKEAAAV
jgi:hypothetical protein